MKNRHALNFVLATLLSMTVLTVHIPFVRAIEWSSDFQLTTHPNQDKSPSIMQAKNGTIWVVWQSKRIGSLNYELFYTTSSDYGSSWSPDKRIPLTEASGYDTNPSIMQLSNGTIWVAWGSDRTGNYDLFYKAFNGTAWSKDHPLTIDPDRDTNPSIIQATNGTIWVVWCSNRTGNSEIHFKKCNGSAWSEEEQLTYDMSADKYPSIMQASDGTIWVVWSRYKTGNYELFYKKCNGSAWSEEEQLTYDKASDMTPSIAQARDGTIWVVWSYYEGQYELYYKIYDGLTWSSDTQLTDNPNSDDEASSIAQINDRKIWVVWAADRDEDFDIYYKTSSEIIIHDVAITNVAPSATRVNPGEIVSISVAAENQGDENKTFDVSCYANTTTIGSATITLANGTSTTLIFSWNTTGVDKGNYTIRAEASVVSDEIDTADNTYIYGTVTVTIPGDVNGDGRVDIYDLAGVDKAYGSMPGDASWDEACDLNDDEVIDIYDLAECGKNYDKTDC